jgi:uncharacterized protein YecT (DUF1311 family)
MEIGIQDRALNQSYRALMGKLDAQGRRRVRASQREWLKSRQRMCAKESDAEGGWEHMDGRMFWYTCFIEKTYQRIDWLDGYASRSAK